MDFENVFHQLRKKTKNILIKELHPDGYWEGYLSSSALSTATAVFALNQFDNKTYDTYIRKGLDWLSKNINEDGGFGDTTKSRSNLSTTLLCWSAFKEKQSSYSDTVSKIEQWLQTAIGNLKPHNIRFSILKHYGKDRTFSVPILMMCALSGRLGKKEAWKMVPQLPFELAIFPNTFFKWLKLDVVSYALPALIAVGFIRHFYNPTKNIPLRIFRNTIQKKLLTSLKHIQPANGGFLEATPLTSFVVMCLASMGYKENIVAQKGITFLIQSIREDGSWPIDTNLSTWVTTLSINALLENKDSKILTEEEKQRIQRWLMNQQFKTVHPFTKASPGGWGWTNLPGSVPDADDTSGALLALKKLESLAPEQTKKSAREGIKWLIKLQNSDGGIPTFCRGWGKLPFDKSCPDITAHALQAFVEWQDEIPCKKMLNKAIKRGIVYLAQTQKDDGSWVPLWFGNQYGKKHENPTYGTAQVVISLRKLQHLPGVKDLLEKGERWLIQNQNDDYGWGSEKGVCSSIEETALALKALATREHREIIQKAIPWLNLNIQKDTLPAAPIGLYFASLWYYEKMYPIVYTVSGLESVKKGFVMNKANVNIFMTFLVSIIAITTLFIWIIQDPTAHFEENGPGMDGTPKNLKISEIVNIGEHFETFTATGKSFPGDWAHFRGKDYDNINKEKIKLANSWKKDGPKILWSLDLGEGYAAPAVYNGKMYLLDYDEEKKADMLRCFFMDNGKELWRRWYKVSIKRNHGISRTVPAVTKDFVVTLGPKCHVMCVETETGKLKWGIDLVRDYKTEVPLWYAGQCPIIEDGIAIIAPVGESVLLMGVECKTGKVLWSTPNTDKWKMSHSSVVPMTIHGKKMYVYSAIGGMIGVSAEKNEKGKVLWKTSQWNHSVVAPSPVLMNDNTIFITAGYGAGSMVIRIYYSDGNFRAKPIDEFPPSEGLASEQQTPILYKGKMFGIQPKDAGGLKKQFVCYNPDDCRDLIWSSGKKKRFGLGPYIVADGKFYILDDKGVLTMIEANTEKYKELGRAKILHGHDSWGPLVIVNGRMLLRDTKRLVCIDLR